MEVCIQKEIDNPLRRKLILHVDTATEWRGGQKQLLLLVQGMIRQGWTTAVACPSKGRLWHELEKHAIRRIAIPKGWSIKTPWILSQARPALLAAHTSHAHGCCSVLSIPLIVHRRVDFVPSGGWKYRRPNGYIAVSQAVRDIVASAGGRNIHVVYDGIEELPMVAPARDGPAVLAVGACVPHKGHRVLSAAAQYLPTVDIGVAGVGALRFPNLRYLGFRSDIAALYAQASVFVHPSVEEGMGQAVVEAMLSQTPVVTTDAGGLPEVVGDCAIIVPKGDPIRLADGIIQALQGKHPSIEKAFLRAQKLFSVDKMVEESLKVYLDVFSI